MENRKGSLSSALKICAFACAMALPLGLAGCGTESSTSARSCETHNTAEIRFQNQSNTSQVYTIMWDGYVLTSVAPGATSDYFTVTAGIPHMLEYKFANTDKRACTVSYPNLTQCSSQTHWCTG